MYLWMDGRYQIKRGYASSNWLVWEFVHVIYHDSYVLVMVVYQKYSLDTMKPDPFYRVRLAVQSLVSPHQRLLATYVNWNKKIRAYLHGRYAIACWRKVFVIKIMCQVLVQYLVYYAINWVRWIIRVTPQTITHICIVRFIHRIHIHRWKRQQRHAIAHRHPNHLQCTTHTVGHHHIQLMIFWPVFIIQLYSVVPVQPFCKRCPRQHNINYRREWLPPINYNQLSKSLTTPIITCTCRIMAYHCIMDMVISKVPTTYRHSLFWWILFLRSWNTKLIHSFLWEIAIFHSF